VAGGLACTAAAAGWRRCGDGDGCGDVDARGGAGEDDGERDDAAVAVGVGERVGDARDEFDGRCGAAERRGSGDGSRGGGERDGECAGDGGDGDRVRSGDARDGERERERERDDERCGDARDGDGDGERDGEEGRDGACERTWDMGACLEVASCCDVERKADAVAGGLHPGWGSRADDSPATPGDRADSGGAVSALAFGDGEGSPECCLQRRVSRAPSSR